MAQVISIEELEAAINKARRVFPPVQGILSPPLRALAEIYGVMIYNHARSADIDGLADENKFIVRQWLDRPTKARSRNDVGDAVGISVQTAASCGVCQ